MKTRKFWLLLVGSLAVASLGACSSSVGAEDAEATSGGVVAFTMGNEDYVGYNSFLPKAYTAWNMAINDRMSAGFGYYLPDGQWHKGGDLGDYEITSENPLTVEYTVAEDAVYQGGTPITCEDFYLDWVSQNPKWIRDAQETAGNFDEYGTVKPLFDNVTGPQSYADAVPQGPQCQAGSKTFKVVYTQPNPDWQLAIGGPLPSHVVAKAIGMDKSSLFKALSEKNYQVAAQAAQFWNSWVASEPGKLQPLDQTPSFGPYTYALDGWKAGEYLKLQRNPDWWGQPGEADQLVFKIMPANQMLQALGKGEVNVIEPAATAQNLADLKQLGDKVKIVQGTSLAYEHLDFNFAKSSIFSDENGSLKLRQAFASCVPRQKIVDEVVKPVDPKAQVLNAFEFLPSQPNYEEAVSQAYPQRYSQVDLEAAKRLLAESGVADPTVRLVHNGDSRRAQTVALIKESCQQAGFKIEEIADPDVFRNHIYNADFDVALFAWSGSGQNGAGGRIFATGGSQNFNRYSSQNVDGQWQVIEQNSNPDVFKPAKIAIEKYLWQDLYGLPLYQHPDIVAYSAGLLNVKPNPTEAAVAWNAEKWGWEQTAKTG